MKELSRHVLIDKLDAMLIRTIANITDNWGENTVVGEEEKEEIRQAYKQIKKIIELWYKYNLWDLKTGIGNGIFLPIEEQEKKEEEEK